MDFSELQSSSLIMLIMTILENELSTNNDSKHINFK